MESIATSAGWELSERAELDWLLESGVLGRSVNLPKALRYVCEETAAGRGDQIKEFSIAVEALGRKPSFDSQVDTIVRVTFHTLRKRLQDIYETGEGKSHTIRILIPAGGYAARFVHLPQTSGHGSSPEIAHAESLSADAAVAPSSPSSPGPQAANRKLRATRSVWYLLTVLLAIAVAAVTLWRAFRGSAPRPAESVSALVAVNGPMHILLGKARHSYLDSSGIRWQPQPACEGGEALPSTGTVVSGTEDSYIYDGGLRGFVRCTLHARAGFYELRVHFAEPSNLEPARRVVSLSVNAGPASTFDVVDRSGGDRAVTTLTLPGISPENDGTIHVDFASEVSPVNALEILPAPTAQALPLRIVAAPTSFKDDRGDVWLSDRYFRGGRRGQPPDHEHRPSLGLYASDRIGTFEYLLPAPTGSKYRVTLYFREPWFGQESGVPGRAGSRVFDVSCNGRAALENFDILSEGQGETVVRTIDGVSPTAQGLLDLQFTPIVNYALVNAIMVTPE